MNTVSRPRNKSIQQESLAKSMLHDISIKSRSPSMSLVSPAKVTSAKWCSASGPVNSPAAEESGLFSPGFTLSSPFGEVPLSCGSALFSPSIFDARRSEANLSGEVEDDFYDTFQITSIASNISTIIALDADEIDINEIESSVGCILSLKDDKSCEDIFDSIEDENYPEEEDKGDRLIVSARVSEKSHNLRKSPERAYNFTSPIASSSRPLKTKAKKNLSDSPEDGTQCKCKKSQCLKLYCDCFASSKYCRSSCKCVDCLNSTDSENHRQDAIKQISERKPTIFKENFTPKAAACMSGCHCKKSKCLKKYCVCYENRTACTDSCKCLSCQNINPPDSSFTDKSSNSSTKADSPVSKFAVGETRPKKVRFILSSRERSDNEADTSFESIILNNDVNICYKSSRLFPASPGLPILPLIKKRRIEDSQTSLIYPFFGENVNMTKLSALRILEFLDNKDLFAVSQVSSLLNSAANDEALWE